MHKLTLGHLPAQEFCDPAVWRWGARALEDPHTHTFHEVFWIEAGEGFHAINGHTRPMGPGYLALVRADDGHTFGARTPGGTIRLCNVPFRTSVWSRLSRRLFPTQRAFFDEPDARRRDFQLDPAALERVRMLAADVFAGARDALSTEAFLVGLVALLANQQRRREQAANAPDWLRAARDGIRVFPNFTGGVARFVALAGRSPEHVARECRRHFAVTPREVVNDARLGHAATRLCTSGHPIAEIALECGFENLGHFYAQFRARYGASPRRYRLNHGAATPAGQEPEGAPPRRRDP